MTRFSNLSSGCFWLIQQEAESLGSGFCKGKTDYAILTQLRQHSLLNTAYACYLAFVKQQAWGGARGLRGGPGLYT